MRYFIRLGYDGTGYHGWQRQPNAVSVQSVIEDALATVMRRPVNITGAGRTDSGVHAREMFAHFDVCEEIADLKKMTVALNRLCGKSIAIHDIFRVCDEAHARFDAVKRTYKYFVLFEKSPFFRNMAWHSPAHIDMELMNEAAGILCGTQDFTSFAKLHSDARTNICTVYEAHWERLEGIDGAVFTISADRFLRNMVRAIVGTLVDVGRGKLTCDDVRNIISEKDRCSAGTSMPAEGLFLWHVDYPYETHANEKDI